ncbi:MAG: hypothetical protein R2861_03580 [Desulfobacterales bacterium]
MKAFFFRTPIIFSGDVSPGQIISAMVERFNHVFLPEWKKQAKAMGFSVLEIVTLASIAERNRRCPPSDR